MSTVITHNDNDNCQAGSPTQAYKKKIVALGACLNSRHARLPTTYALSTECSALFPSGVRN